jgi:hypothetical protein
VRRNTSVAGLISATATRMNRSMPQTTDIRRTGPGHDASRRILRGGLQRDDLSRGRAARHRPPEPPGQRPGAWRHSRTTITNARVSSTSPTGPERLPPEAAADEPGAWPTQTRPTRARRRQRRDGSDACGLHALGRRDDRSWGGYGDRLHPMWPHARTGWLGLARAP